MAVRNKTAAQNKNPKKYRSTTKTMVSINHKITESMAAPMLSPTAGGSKSKFPISGAFSEYFSSLCLLNTFPTFSFNFRPKYKLKLINRKKVPAKIEVDKIEF